MVGGLTRIVQHVVRHGDLTDVLGIGGLMGMEKAAIFYSDPPWGQGNLNYWQTINTKMTNAPKIEIDFQRFLDRVFYLAWKYTRGPVFIEYGTRWMVEIIDMAEKYELSHIGMATVNYRSGSSLLPMHLHVFSKEPLDIPDGYFNSIAGTHGMATLRAAVTPFAVLGGIILDPACGMGNTARIACATGMRFRGNEINEARLAKTIKYLEGAWDRKHAKNNQ